MDAFAPGVVKLTGEHLVLYGTPAVAAAIDVKARAEVRKGYSDELRIHLMDTGFQIETVLSREDLFDLYKKYKGNDLKSFLGLADGFGIDRRLLPYAVIAARLSNEHGIPLVGESVEITSDIPTSRGFASSGACATAFTVALIRTCGGRLDDETIIDVARDGERIVHENPNAGGIDVYTSYYGGVVTYGKNTPASQIQIPKGFELPIFFVDTGPKRPTREAVAKVKQFSEDNPELFAELKVRVDHCSTGLIKALQAGDLNSIERLMGENQDVLKELGVSSEGLDKAVEAGRANGIPSLKLTGGGMGGMAIGIAPMGATLALSAMKELGFEAGLTSITQNGAKTQLKSVNKSI
ncbi:MAG: mevalonate kinase [Candidatus Micrarchaeales archaeon]